VRGGNCHGGRLLTLGHRLCQFRVPRSRSFDVAVCEGEGCFSFSRPRRSSVTVALGRAIAFFRVVPPFPWGTLVSEERWQVGWDALSTSSLASPSPCLCASLWSTFIDDVPPRGIEPQSRRLPGLHYMAFTSFWQHTSRRGTEKASRGLFLRKVGRVFEAHRLPNDLRWASKTRPTLQLVSEAETFGVDQSLIVNNIFALVGNMSVIVANMSSIVGNMSVIVANMSSIVGNMSVIV